MLKYCSRFSNLWTRASLKREKQHLILLKQTLEMRLFATLQRVILQPDFPGINEIREQFNKRNASIMPNLEDFNQMFRQYADGLLNSDNSVFPPGHPLYNREKSFSLLKDANDKLIKENLELKKQLEKSEKKSTNSNFKEFLIFCKNFI